MSRQRAHAHNNHDNERDDILYGGMVDVDLAGSPILRERLADLVEEYGAQRVAELLQRYRIGVRDHHA
jgi:hypothetical protein